MRVKEGNPDSWQKRATERNFDILEVVEKIAREREKSCAQITLAWIRSRQGVIASIIGARTLEQFENNLGSLEIELSLEELRSLDEISQPESEYPYSFLRQNSRYYPY